MIFFDSSETLTERRRNRLAESPRAPPRGRSRTTRRTFGSLPRTPDHPRHFPRETERRSRCPRAGVNRPRTGSGGRTRWRGEEAPAWGEPWPPPWTEQRLPWMKRRGGSERSGRVSVERWRGFRRMKKVALPHVEANKN